MSRSSLVLLALVLGAYPAGHAQAFPDDSTDDNPVDAKATAQRLRDLRRTEPRELARASHDAARAAYEVRLHRIRSGTDTPDTVVDLFPRLLAADLDLADGRAGRLAALEKYWVRLREIEGLTRERVEAGVKNFTSAHYWAARCERLLAELRLVRELGAGKPLPGAILGGLSDVDPLDAGAAARDAFAATRAAELALARAARDAPVNEYRVRIRRIGAGTDSPDLLLSASIRHVRAARASGDNPAELLGVLEAHWHTAWDIELLTRERVEAGVKNFTPAVYSEAQDGRLEAEAWIVEGRRQPGKLLPLQGGLQDPFGETDDPLETRDVARAKFDAARADLGHPALRRRQVILAGYAVREQRVRGGTDLPERALYSERKLAAVELTLATDRAERFAALERHWARACTIEDLVRERVEAGVKLFTPADFLEARYERLRAELRLAEARAAKE